MPSCPWGASSSTTKARSVAHASSAATAATAAKDAKAAKAAKAAGAAGAARPQLGRSARICETQRRPLGKRSGGAHGVECGEIFASPRT